MNNQQFSYQYTGEDLYQPKTQVEDAEGRIYYPYLPSENLKVAVELAIALERPLLLEGEPGCGKTRLAGAVAYEFTQRYLRGSTDSVDPARWWPFTIWNVKSTTRAKDGLYTFDAVARLRDAQLMGSDPQRLQDYLGQDETQQLQSRLKDRRNYREFGPLGRALWQSPSPVDEWKQGLRPIVLIDEIDKADSDFANDLLLELDEMRFEVPETGESIPPPAQKPIIFITSNRERPLPEALLRRCLYFYVEFPDHQRLIEIINKRFGAQAPDKEAVVNKARERFYQIRSLAEHPPKSRPPGTSEFIDFLSAVLSDGSTDVALKNLEDLSTSIPLLGTLLKTKPDQQRFLDSQ